MKNLVQNFTKQLQEAKTIASKAIIGPSSQINNIVISGLGGSGIGGSIVAELVSDYCALPVVINKDYHLPAFVNTSTLLIISSYSGNTEETLSAMEQGISKKAQIVCITGGGKVLELAKQHQYEFIEIPSGFPPRSCIGYSLVQLLRVFVNKGFADAKIFADLDKSIQLLDSENVSIKKQAEHIAEKLQNKIPVIYSLGSSEAVALDFVSRFNENSKMLCWHHTFPEMNHNELVGWTVNNENLVLLTCLTCFDYSRTVKRYEICKPLFQKYASEVIDIHAKGESKLEQFFYLINIGDWISCYIADLKGIDPVEVNVITHLKDALSKI